MVGYKSVVHNNQTPEFSLDPCPILRRPGAAINVVHDEKGRYGVQVGFVVNRQFRTIISTGSEYPIPEGMNTDGVVEAELRALKSPHIRAFVNGLPYEKPKGN